METTDSLPFMSNVKCLVEHLLTLKHKVATLASSLRHV